MDTRCPSRSRLVDSVVSTDTYRDRAGISGTGSEIHPAKHHAGIHRRRVKPQGVHTFSPVCRPTPVAMIDLPNVRWRSIKSSSVPLSLIKA